MALREKSLDLLLCATSVFSVSLWLTKSQKVATETLSPQWLHREIKIQDIFRARSVEFDSRI